MSEKTKRGFLRFGICLVLLAAVVGVFLLLGSVMRKSQNEKNDGQAVAAAQSSETEVGHR